MDPPPLAILQGDPHLLSEFFFSRMKNVSFSDYPYPIFCFFSLLLHIALALPGQFEIREYRTFLSTSTGAKLSKQAYLDSSGSRGGELRSGESHFLIGRGSRENVARALP